MLSGPMQPRKRTWEVERASVAVEIPLVVAKPVFMPRSCASSRIVLRSSPSPGEVPMRLSLVLCPVAKPVADADESVT